MTISGRQCDRCHGPAPVHTMSFFNLDIICMGCKEREKEHPLYAEARRAEEEALRSGDHHFPGIGCPPELYRPA